MIIIIKCNEIFQAAYLIVPIFTVFCIFLIIFESFKDISDRRINKQNIMLMLLFRYVFWNDHIKINSSKLNYSVYFANKHGNTCNNPQLPLHWSHLTRALPPRPGKHVYIIEQHTPFYWCVILTITISTCVVVGRACVHSKNTFIRVNGRF